MGLSPTDPRSLCPLLNLVIPPNNIPGYATGTHSSVICYTAFLCVQSKTPDDGQRNSPKQVVFYSKNKFEKLVHLVGFIIRICHICHDARSPERQIHEEVSTSNYVISSIIG